MAISKINTGPDGTKYLKFYCVGCRSFENIPIERNGAPFWEFSGTEQNPTLSPSVKHSEINEKGEPIQTICHYNLIDGFLNYCADCVHEFKSQRVPLPEMNFDQ